MPPPGMPHGMPPPGYGGPPPGACHHCAAVPLCRFATLPLCRFVAVLRCRFAALAHINDVGVPIAPGMAGMPPGMPPPGMPPAQAVPAPTQAAAPKAAELTVAEYMDANPGPLQLSVTMPDGGQRSVQVTLTETVKVGTIAWVESNERHEKGAPLQAIKLATCPSVNKPPRLCQELKAKLETLSALPPNKQKLNVAGIGFLKDADTLGFYKLSAATTLELTAKTRGGR